MKREVYTITDWIFAKENTYFVLKFKYAKIYLTYYGIDLDYILFLNTRDFVNGPRNHIIIYIDYQKRNRKLLDLRANSLINSW